MTDPSHAGAGADSSESARLETSTDGVTVRKEPDLHGGEVVAVRLTLVSSRDDRCIVRVEDALPETLQDNPVEFHPAYDPENWTKADGAVVYEVPLQPAEKRITVYGVGVDDPGHLEHFSAPPTVERSVAPATPPIEGESDPGDSVTDDPFAYGATRRSGGSADSEVAEGQLQATDSADTEPPSPATDSPPTDTDAESPVVDGPPSGAGERHAPGSEPPGVDLVGGLVAEVSRRDLTEAEQSALREALGLDTRLQPLQEAVEALREEVEAADSRPADVDRLAARVDTLADELAAVQSSLTAEIEAVQESLSAAQSTLEADLGTVEETLAQEVRWRSQLRQGLQSDPADEPTELQVSSSELGFDGIGRRLTDAWHAL